MKNNKLNQIGILRIQLKKLYVEIKNCKGIQSVQLWSKIGEVKQKISNISK